jgi:hypothetical protein
MAILYKWTINQLNAKIESDGQDNVVYNIHYSYTGIDEEDMQYQNTIIGTYSVTYVPGTPFIPWADDQAFENVVIEWLINGLDVSSMRDSIAANIALQKNPVDEDLYFTFNNPTPPPTEES